MKKGTTFKTIRVFVVILAAIIIAIVLVILRPEAERRVPEETGRLVEVFAVVAEKVQMVIESYGTVEPREALKLVAEVRGQIVATDPSFKEGDFVTKGSRLIQVDPRTYQLEVQRRNVQIKQAEVEIRRLQQEVLNLQARIKISFFKTRVCIDDLSANFSNQFQCFTRFDGAVCLNVHLHFLGLGHKYLYQTPRFLHYTSLGLGPQPNQYHSNNNRYQYNCKYSYRFKGGSLFHRHITPLQALINNLRRKCYLH